MITTVRRNFIKKASICSSGLVIFPETLLVKHNSKANICLIGDSILLDYSRSVQEELSTENHTWISDTANLNSQILLDNVSTWLSEQSPDIIHINTGIHDVRSTTFDTEDPSIPLDLYLYNIQNTIKRLHTNHPKAQIIWATTTPVIDHLVKKDQADKKRFHLKDQNIQQYNEALMALINRLGVGLNDLYKIVNKSGGERLFKYDGIHLNKLGNKYLSDWVAETIQLFL